MESRHSSLLVVLAVALATTVIWWFGLRTDEAPSADGAAPAPASAARPTVAPEPAVRYDDEYPAVGYTTRMPTDRVSRLAAALARGEVMLGRDASRGYLDAVLDALEIDVASQMLVFSKTSLQTEGITAATPRAVYFNDDTYVAWVPGASTLEIASLDPVLGPVFYTLAQAGGAQPDAGSLERQLGRCLRCHDSLSLTGGGVPRLITGSGYTGRDGAIVAHEGWILTSDRTPLRSRWGGWYVTGYHGEQVHLGNIAVASVYELERLEELRTGNLETLDGLLDTAPYPSDLSDIVALLVLEHQVRAQNAIVRAGYDVRTALAAAGMAESAEPSVLPELGVDLEPLVEALLFAGEAPLGDSIRGTSGFAEAFVARGARDAQGRTLRALDLETRLFAYPVSYVMLGDAFRALPEPARRWVYARVRALLEGPEIDPKFASLAAADRAATLEVLRATSPDFMALTSN